MITTIVAMATFTAGDVVVKFDHATEAYLVTAINLDSEVARLSPSLASVEVVGGNQNHAIDEFNRRCKILVRASLSPDRAKGRYQEEITP